MRTQILSGRFRPSACAIAFYAAWATALGLPTAASAADAAEAPATAKPADVGDWGVMESLAGKSYSGRVTGGVGVIRFHKSNNNTYTMTFGMVGEKPSSVVLSLVGKNVAAISYLEGPGIGPRGTRKVYNRVNIKDDGFVIEWDSSPTCVVRAGGGRYGCFFSRLSSDSGVQITTFQVEDDGFIENPSSTNGGRVEFKRFS